MEDEEKPPYCAFILGGCVRNTRKLGRKYVKSEIKLYHH
jgi:hypothetical protein